MCLCFCNTLFPFPQPKGKKAKGKKVAPAPSVAKKHEAKKVVNPLFEKRPKNFGIGEYLQVPLYWGHKLVVIQVQMM